MKTWVLTGSPENFAATREHGFSVIELLPDSMRSRVKA
jgi:hypothetical protein